MIIITVIRINNQDLGPHFDHAKSSQDDNNHTDCC